ncbi:MAG: amidohydrolase [Ruminococcus sp.]|jgi:predicted amidohydrolase YtcJ
MAWETTADLIFYNGSVVTVDEKDWITDSLAVKGRKILAVGSYDEVIGYAGRNTRYIDLKGRTLMPGFIEAHSHFALTAILENGVVIPTDWKRAGSIEQLKTIIRNAASRTEPGKWIITQGYDQNKLQERRHPTIQDLDEAAPDHPVWCVRADLHMGVCNTMALKKAGISKETMGKFQPGEVEVDEQGNLTGLLKEEGFGYLNSFVEYDDEKLREAFILGDRLFLSMGITSVHDAGTYGAQFIRILQDAALKRQIHVRIYELIYRMLGKYSIREFVYDHIKTGLHTGMGNEYFRLGPAKLLLDGSSSGPSSYTRQPYSHDPDLKGIINWTQDEVDQFMADAQKAGFQLTAHAVGDKAVEMMIHAIEKAQKMYPREDCRPRIEHCALVDEEILDKIKELGIIPISNPGLLAFNAKDYNRYYGDRVKMMFAHKSYVDRDILFAAGADSPCMNVNPMIGLWGAVARKDMINGVTCGENQKISILDAVRMFTYNGAYASFEEKIKGSLEPGKLADFIILSENLLESETDHIPDIKVDATFLDGEEVYVRERRS